MCVTEWSAFDAGTILLSFHPVCTSAFVSQSPPTRLHIVPCRDPNGGTPEARMAIAQPLNVRHLVMDLLVNLHGLSSYNNATMVSV